MIWVKEWCLLKEKKLLLYVYQVTSKLGIIWRIFIFGQGSLVPASIKFVHSKVNFRLLIV